MRISFLTLPPPKVVVTTFTKNYISALEQGFAGVRLIIRKELDALVVYAAPFVNRFCDLGLRDVTRLTDRAPVYVPRHSCQFVPEDVPINK